MALEDEFYRKINQVVSRKITPVYNTIMLIFCACFGYFCIIDQNQCYAREQNAWAINYSNTEDVTHQWYLMSCSGLIFLLVSTLMYNLQGKQDMFNLMRPYVIVINLITLTWFIILQYYRFKDTGRACAGEFLTPGKIPGNFGTVYLADQGKWLKYYIISQYALYII